MEIKKDDLGKTKTRVVNMVVNGKFPFYEKLKSQEIIKIIKKGSLKWNSINNESSPMLIATIGLEGFNKKNEQRKASITIWHSGSFNLAGVITKSEIDKCCEDVLNDLIKLVPRIFIKNDY